MRPVFYSTWVVTWFQKWFKVYWHRWLSFLLLQFKVHLLWCPFILQCSTLLQNHHASLAIPPFLLAPPLQQEEIVCAPWSWNCHGETVIVIETIRGRWKIRGNRSPSTWQAWALICSGPQEYSPLKQDSTATALPASFSWLFWVKMTPYLCSPKWVNIYTYSYGPMSNHNNR